MTKTDIRTGRLAFAASCALISLSQPSAAGDVYKKMANDIARYAQANKVRNVAVIAFNRRARTSREESEYVSEKLLTCLVKSGKVNLMERDQLGKVMEEQKLALSGAAEGGAAMKPGQLHTADAIITGTVFGTKNRLKIITRIIDSLTGTVLHTIEGETDRQWEMLNESPDFDFEVPDPAALVVMFGEDAGLPVFDDFRDSPGGFTGAFDGLFGARPSASYDRDFKRADCAVRWFRVAVMQTGAVDAKAKYWARQLRDPDFSAKDLKSNPGGEIKDPEIKKKFYELLDMYYKAGEPPRLTQEEANTVAELSTEEKQVSSECGMI